MNIHFFYCVIIGIVILAGIVWGCAYLSYLYIVLDDMWTEIEIARYHLSLICIEVECVFD